jgi:hypothetical protein
MTQDMTEDQVMAQLTQAVRDDDPFAADAAVRAGQQQHPAWDWQLIATVLWVQRNQQEEDPPAQPAWRGWLRRLWRGGHW